MEDAKIEQCWGKNLTSSSPQASTVTGCHDSSLGCDLLRQRRRLT